MTLDWTFGFSSYSYDPTDGMGGNGGSCTYSGPAPPVMGESVTSADLFVSGIHDSNGGKTQVAVSQFQQDRSRSRSPAGAANVRRAELDRHLELPLGDDAHLRSPLSSAADAHPAPSAAQPVEVHAPLIPAHAGRRSSAARCSSCARPSRAPDSGAVLPVRDPQRIAARANSVGSPSAFQLVSLV